MRAVIQRVRQAAVRVDDQTVGAIDTGLVIFVGVTHADTDADARWLAQKIATLRIFEDAAGKFNLSALEVGARARRLPVHALRQRATGPPPRFHRRRATRIRRAADRTFRRILACAGAGRRDRQIPSAHARHHFERWSCDDPARFARARVTRWLGKPDKIRYG